MFRYVSKSKYAAKMGQKELLARALGVNLVVVTPDQLLTLPVVVYVKPARRLADPTAAFIRVDEVG